MHPCQIRCPPIHEKENALHTLKLTWNDIRGSAQGTRIVYETEICTTGIIRFAE